DDQADGAGGGAHARGGVVLRTRKAAAQPDDPLGLCQRREPIRRRAYPRLGRPPRVAAEYRQERRRAASSREATVEVDLVEVSGGMGAGRWRHDPLAGSPSFVLVLAGRQTRRAGSAE